MNDHRYQRAYMALVAIFLFSAPTAHADDTESTQESLRGLNGVQFILDDLPAEVEKSGLSANAIRTDVELRLRQAGIPVLAINVSNPELYVSVDVITSTTSDVWPFMIRVNLGQNAALKRDPSIFLPGVGTWGVTLFGDIHRQNLRRLRDDIKDLVDKFVNAYLRVNPK